MISNPLKRYIPEEVLGVLDYCRSPEWSMILGGVFSGQSE
jgi:hypothetical protein